MNKEANNMHEWPMIHDDRCHASSVRFTDEHAMIHLADGRIIGVPLGWFPPIQGATDEQRQNYTSYGSSIYWQDVDDGIDLTAMLTGLYIVPVFQRALRNEPHVPETWLYLEGGSQQSSDGMEGVPFVHDSRNIPKAFHITDEHLIFDLEDGRILCLPAHFSLGLMQASDNRRTDYKRKGLKLRWEELDEEIDLIAMLTGFYAVDQPGQNDVIETADATAT